MGMRVCAFPNRRGPSVSRFCLPDQACALFSMPHGCRSMPLMCHVSEGVILRFAITLVVTVHLICWVVFNCSA
jgi:hypothetical protein